VRLNLLQELSWLIEKESSLRLSWKDYMFALNFDAKTVGWFMVRRAVCFSLDFRFVESNDLSSLSSVV